MIKIRLDELSEPLRQQLASIGDEESIVIEDENGQPRYGVIPYRRPTAEQKRTAWERLRKLQDKDKHLLELKSYQDITIMNRQQFAAELDHLGVPRLD